MYSVCKCSKSDRCADDDVQVELLGCKRATNKKNNNMGDEVVGGGIYRWTVYRYSDFCNAYQSLAA